ncbi:MAG: radical SAM family heme chaperone HemW [Nitrospiraceae bacterium]|nr:radical SAM family heme chaperone HemW [Nitrospiraceae bacterium]
MSVGVYIHIPFCRTRCHFCAFYLQIYRRDRALAYLDSLSHEISLHAAQDTLEGRRPESVYFGGGTPTILPPGELAKVLQLIRKQFNPRDDAEITLEAHPDTVDEEGLKDLRQAGFNRISFGVQSMDQDELIRIGRRTVPDRTRAAVSLARHAGFENINLDLIYGLPGQSLESWRSTLRETIALNPSHLSCYALTIEDGTLLQRERQGDPAETEQSLQIAMENLADGELISVGFHRYEISSFCEPGFACRHNLLYWTGGDYLGLGPSAQSYLNGVRMGNVEDLKAYRTALKEGRLPLAHTERLSSEQRRREALVFGLRLTDGIAFAPLGGQARHNDTSWNDALERMINDGLVEAGSGRIRLTEMGRRFADSVAVALL